MRAAHVVGAEFEIGEIPALLDRMENMVGKLLDRRCAIGQLVDGAGHVAGDPARIDTCVGQDHLNVGAVGQDKLLDEMGKLDIRIAAQLGRIGRGLEGAYAERIELSDKLLAFETLRRSALLRGTWLHGTHSCLIANSQTATQRRFQKERCRHARHRPWSTMERLFTCLPNAEFDRLRLKLVWTV